MELKKPLDYFEKNPHKFKWDCFRTISRMEKYYFFKDEFHARFNFFVHHFEKKIEQRKKLSKLTICLKKEYSRYKSYYEEYGFCHEENVKKITVFLRKKVKINNEFIQKIFELNKKLIPLTLIKEEILRNYNWLLDQIYIKLENDCRSNEFYFFDENCYERKFDIPNYFFD